MGEFQKDDRLELVYEDGRPSHFKEKPRNANSSLSTSESWAAFMPAKKLASSAASSSSSSSLRSGESPNTPDTSPRVGLGISGCTTPAGSYTSENELAVAKSSKSVSGAPDYGRRLLPQIIDELAASHPEQSLFSLSTMVKNVLEFREVSARQFAQAIDKTAWWLQDKVGKQTAIQPIGYIGPRTFSLTLGVAAC